MPDIPADVPVDVYIAKSRGDLENLPAPVIAILADNANPGWNDFGRNFFATFFVNPAEGLPLDFDARVMFEGVERTDVALTELFEKFGDVFHISAIKQPFVSLLPDVDMYREVVETLGFDLGVSALRVMHDATVARVEGSNEQQLRLIASEDFNFGALRLSAAYVALLRGGRYFRPNPPPVVEDLATDFVFSARMISADNFYTLPFRFGQNGLFRDRISVLIGRNGVGKTNLLKAIIDALHKSGEPKKFHQRFFPALRPSRVIVFSSIPTDPFPRSIGAWLGIDYEYHSVNFSDNLKTDTLLAALVACRKSDEKVFGENRDKSRLDIIRDALTPLGLWGELCLPLRRRTPQDKLPHVIEIDDESYFPIRLDLTEESSISLLQQIDWDRTAVNLDATGSIRLLSSGELAMMRFAAQAASAIEQGSLLLLDEPETHLHPNFISNLMDVLDNMLKSTGSIAIIATHSAYVVRETPRDRVHVLTLEDRQIHIDRPRLQTFGANIDSISQFVFGDTSLLHNFQRTLADWADRTGRELGIEGVIRRFGAELNSESLSFIARRLAEVPPPQPEEVEPEV